MAQTIRGNSLYTIVDGASWTQAEANSVLLNGHLVTINSAEENKWIGDTFRDAIAAPDENWNNGLRAVAWIGLNDIESDGNPKWADGTPLQYSNFLRDIHASGTTGRQDGWISLLLDPSGAAQQYAGLDSWLEDGVNVIDPTGDYRGIAEIPLTLSITRTGIVKEGGGVFTTSINLSAGNQTSGNLAEGATVYWQITGITADDLASGALTGSGTITNGKLDLQHSLVSDADTGEQLSVSVYSDSARTLQIGNTSSTSIAEAPNTFAATSAGAKADPLTGERTIDLSTTASKVTAQDGIIDRLTLQTSAAPSNPWRITEFNPQEDILQIPSELAGAAAQKTLFGIQKVTMPDRPLTKSEQKSFKKQQKAVSKSVKRIGRTGDGFAYNQLTGELFLDTNGSKKGFGEGGGLIAVLEDTPAIGINNFQFL